MKKLLLLSAMLLSCGIICLAQSLSGSWNGKLTLGPQSLTIVLNIASDGSCTLDSPDQGAKGIPCATQHLSTDSIRIDIPAIGGSYSARLTGGKLVGNFVQMGYSFPLELVPGEAIPERPQTPTPPFGYETREVTFANAAAGVTLAGTLTLPQGHDHSTPVVLMVTGSGLQNRDEEIFDHKPFLVIADFLARNGIATLRYDDRGAGKSTGDAANGTTENNMKDALAAVEYARATGKFGRTGVLGHSEGGAIAFMLAARGKADFIVSMAGPGLRGDSILLAQNRRGMMQGGVPANMADDYCKVLAKMFAVMAQPGTVSDPAAKVREIAKETGVSLPEPLVQNFAKSMEICTPWLKYFIGYDPSADIRGAKCPVMAVNGSKDVQVVAADNLAAIRRLLPENSLNLIKEYPGLNHLFQHCTTGLTTEYGQIEETVSPEVMQDIAAWIAKVAR